MKGALTKRLDSTSATCAPCCATRTCAMAASTRRRPPRHRPLPRRRNPRTRPASPFRDSQPTCGGRAGDASELRLVATLKPQASRRSRNSPQAEHHHPAQPDQRTRRRRAGHPAAGRRPHRRPAAGRAGYRQGQGHPGRTADPGNPPGRRLDRCARPALAGNSAVRHRVYNERGGQPLLVKKQVVLTGDRLTDAQPGFDSQTRNRRCTSTLMPPAPASSDMTARTSASAWPSC